MTCHFNGQGGGQLNDYGRALWATEIAARHFVSKYSVEELGEVSNFLFGKPLPWWTRLGLKARQIWAKRNPFRDQSDSFDILMQADANLAFFYDRDQKYAFITTLGYASEQLQQFNSIQGKGESAFISREHYFRIQVSRPLWLYVGKMDKVFGIRHANHTAYSRTKLGLSHSDQSYGLIAQYSKPDWEFTGNLFLGDLAADRAFQEKGLSFLYEYDLKDKWRVGASLLFSKSDVVSRNALGIQSRWGFGEGLSLMAESGLLSQKQGTDSKSQLGYFFYSEAMQKVARGYHLFVSAQAYKADLSGNKADNLKFGAGFLIFPFQRMEWRLEIENAHQVFHSSQDVQDSWSVYGQLHLSI